MDYFLHCAPTVYIAKIIMANYKGTTADAELLFCLASDKWCIRKAPSNYLELEGDKILVTWWKRKKKSTIVEEERTALRNQYKFIREHFLKEVNKRLKRTDGSKKEWMDTDRNERETIKMCNSGMLCQFWQLCINPVWQLASSCCSSWCLYFWVQYLLVVYAWVTSPRR